ncbi:SDR family oxidoreductase [Rhizobium sp. BK251]|uniref:SDR family oxidoreductase n=1 Tax=Rhizobium sp. BK251 TaxID=2512125 RepID=UPI0010DC5E0E|nr:SDR family oxidoreductase [Rhizobium sp. BK251]TCL74797.1 nucleoside-diphosphate-sugar epimerase [Rhizobium sp. BK251]
MTMQTTTENLALVLGATGGIGGAMARELAARGWHVRALSRNGGRTGQGEPSVEWVRGDAMNAADVRKAAEGVQLIVHAVNPPGYKDWEKLVLPMLENTIAAATAVGARIVLPGTVYNFGPDAFPLLTEQSRQNPRTRKGAIRKEMERRLKEAARKGTKVLIVRAGDFFGPGAANNWFTQSLVKPGKVPSSTTYPGRAGVGHQWAYLPDVAETMIRLIERGEELEDFAVYHMDGFWDFDGGQMITATERAVGGRLKVRSFPWWLLPVGGLFVTVLRELREMRYLWQVPLRMSNAKLVSMLGEEPRTPIDEAVRSTLASFGCLPEMKQEMAAACQPLSSPATR